MTNCPNCGAVISPGSFGCEYCGSIFDDEINKELTKLRSQQDDLKAILRITETHIAWENQMRNIIRGLYKW